jgi:hypothetical protein
LCLLKMHISVFFPKQNILLVVLFSRLEYSNFFIEKRALSIFNKNIVIEYYSKINMYHILLLIFLEKNVSFNVLIIILVRVRYWAYVFNLVILGLLYNFYFNMECYATLLWYYSNPSLFVCLFYISIVNIVSRAWFGLPWTTCWLWPLSSQKFENEMVIQVSTRSARAGWGCATQPSLHLVFLILIRIRIFFMQKLIIFFVSYKIDYFLYYL